MHYYKFCPKCAESITVKVVQGQERHVCSSNICDFIHWNNPIPVVGGIIETEKGIVLAKNSLWSDDVYSIITGFIEFKESPVDAIIRECYEELGLMVSSVSLVGNYPFVSQNQIILVYHLVASGEIVMSKELDSVKLFSKKELEEWPFGQEKLNGWPFGCGWAIRDWLATLSINKL